MLDVTVYPERIKAQELLGIVLDLHTQVLQFDTEGLRKRILEFPKYVLRSISLDDLSLNFDGWGNDARVWEYLDMDMDMDMETQPPIVLGHRMLPSGKLNVIDGIHRTVARHLSGLNIVWAYLPTDDSRGDE